MRNNSAPSHFREADNQTACYPSTFLPVLRVAFPVPPPASFRDRKEEGSITECPWQSTECAFFFGSASLFLLREVIKVLGSPFPCSFHTVTGAHRAFHMDESSHDTPALQQTAAPNRQEREQF